MSELNESESVQNVGEGSAAVSANKFGWHWYDFCRQCGEYVTDDMGHMCPYPVDKYRRFLAEIAYRQSDEIAEQRKRIAELENIIKSLDDKNLAATNRVGLPPFGCDTADHLADEIEEAKERVAELEAENETAWSARDKILKDRNALLNQLNKGPLSSDEWQIRAIRAEAESEQLAADFKATSESREHWKRRALTTLQSYRKQKRDKNQLAASLETVKTLWREHLNSCVPLSNYKEIYRLWEELAASLETARKALDAINALVVCSSVTMERTFFRFITTGQDAAIKLVREALTQLSSSAASTSSETEDLLPSKLQELYKDPEFQKEYCAEMERETAALEERDRAIAKESATRCMRRYRENLKLYQDSGQPFSCGVVIGETEQDIRRMFGMEEG